MRRKRSNFLEQLQRRREAGGKDAPPKDKPVSEMSSEELDREVARLQAEERRLKEDAVEAGRQTTSRRPALFPRTRRYWK